MLSSAPSPFNCFCYSALRISWAGFSAACASRGVVGEILAGVLLGPSILGQVAPGVSKAILPSGIVSGAWSSHETVFGFLYNLGLLLLMFISGAEIRGIFTRHDRREVAWLGIVGTGLPFAVVMAGHKWLPLGTLMGPTGQQVSLLLVVGIAVAVTSIPVISRILYDLDVLHTCFARLVAVATALAGSGGCRAVELESTCLAPWPISGSG
jgi:Kef-type K+ transport system membrane component KefB